MDVTQGFYVEEGLSVKLLKCKFSRYLDVKHKPRRSISEKSIFVLIKEFMFTLSVLIDLPYFTFHLVLKTILIKNNRPLGHADRDDLLMGSRF